MAPNDHVPIPNAQLWDIIDIGTMRQLAARAPKGDPDRKNPDHGRTCMAREVVSGISDRSDEDRFLWCAKAWIGYGSVLERRNRAGDLARTCGASPARLIAYLNWKVGLFRRNYSG